MRRRLTSLLLLCIAFWLPVQAASAMVMPFCRHAAAQTTESLAQDEFHCHESLPQAADPSAGIDCDDCEMCHLATAGYLPATVASLMPEATSVLVALPSAAPPSHVADPPQQPPRRLN